MSDHQSLILGVNMAFFETAMRLEAEEIKKLQQGRKPSANTLPPCCDASVVTHNSISAEYQKLAIQKSTSESQLMENNIVKEVSWEWVASRIESAWRRGHGASNCSERVGVDVALL